MDNYPRRQNPNPADPSSLEDVAIALNDLAWIHNKLGSAKDALKVYEEALAAIVKDAKHLGTESEAYAVTLFNVADMKSEMKRFADAEKDLRVVSRLRAKILGKEDYEYGNTLYALAFVLENLGRHEESAGFYDDAADVMERATGDAMDARKKADAMRARCR